MLKVLIADDEINICNLICYLLDWEGLNLTLSGVVYDGNEAYQKIIEDQPDILITDIRMPGMDGMELIEKAKLVNPNIKVIIISGYKQFDYAYKAVKYGVVDFILKPINKSELNETINKLIGQIMNNDQQQQEIAQINILKSKLVNSQSRMRNLFIMNLARKSNPAEIYDIEHINREYDYKFQPGLFCIAVLFLSSSKEPMENLNESIFTKISRHFPLEFKQKFFDMESSPNNNKLLMIFNFDKKFASSFKYDLAYFFTIALSLVSPYPLMNATLGVGGNFEKPEEIHLSYEQAELAVKSRLALGCNRVIYAQDLNLEFESASLNISKEFQNRLALAIETQQKSVFFEVSSQIWQTYQPIVQKHPYIIYELYDMVLTYSTDLFFQYFQVPQDANNFKEGFSSSITKIDSLKALNDCFQEYINKLFDELEINKNINRKVIQMAKQYVLEHYSDHIELETVASTVHLTPAYFGILFKKETGIPFSEYLIQFRIDKAKELLKNIDYNVNEIARMVGYKNAKYFSKVFKKAVGIKPTEFRRIYNI
jgi:two-component system, response regulator YesN